MQTTQLRYGLARAGPYSGAGTIHPHTFRPHKFRPRTFRPHTIRLSTLFPDIFTSPYVSSMNEPQPTELHQPWIGWAFSLT